jgi:hypothetical protein
MTGPIVLAVYTVAVLCLLLAVRDHGPHDPT